LKYHNSPLILIISPEETDRQSGLIASSESELLHAVSASWFFTG